MIRYCLPIVLALLFVVGRCSTADDRTNIVLIYVDDFGWRDTGFNGSRFYETPNMNRIAQEGMNFINAYSNAPNCAPSRACLMSGQYSPRHGIFTVGNSDRGKSNHRKLIPIQNRTELPARNRTMAEVIQDAGYATCFLGKWHLGDRKSTRPTGQGFDENFGGCSWGHPKAYFSPYRNPFLVDGPKGEYLTDRLSEEAIGFIKRNAAKKNRKPFFVMLSHYAVHTPLQAKAGMIRKYQKKKKTDGQNNATYAAMIESVDQGVGQILDLLVDLEIDRKTLVILYSDNGGHGGATSNSPLRGCKGMLYEGGIRVPLAMRWPGTIPPNSLCAVPVIGTDLYPTLAEIARSGSNHLAADSARGKVLDGESLIPLMTRQGNLKRDAIFWHFPAYLQGKYPRAHNDDPYFRTRPAGAIRKGDWKLIEFFEDGGTELFNMRIDPGETRNLAAEKPEIHQELYRDLKTWQRKTKAPIPKTTNPDYRAD